MDTPSGHAPGQARPDAQQQREGNQLITQLGHCGLVKMVAAFALAVGGLFFASGINSSPIGVISYCVVVAMYAAQVVIGWRVEDRLRAHPAAGPRHRVPRTNRVLEGVLQAWLLGTFAFVTFLPGRVVANLVATAGLLALGTVWMWHQRQVERRARRR